MPREDRPRPARRPRVAGLRRPAGPPPAPVAESSLPPAARVIGGIVAPTTLVTGLMFYFGWLHAFWFCYYFGVNSTLLGFTTQDYLMRSVDGLVVPLTVGVLLVLAAVAVHRRLTAARSGSRAARAALRVVETGSFAGGVLLVLVGASYVLGAGVLREGIASAFCLALGATLLPYAASLRRRRRALAEPSASTALAVWTGTFLLVGVGLFLAAGDYSARVGTARAQATVAKLPASPVVVLFSARSLALSYAGAQETVCPGAEAAYRYRYDGLKLVLQSGNTYFLVPERWSPRAGQAILLPRQDAVRLDYSAPGSGGPPARRCA